jgi:hypothetical protein
MCSVCVSPHVRRNKVIIYISNINQVTHRVTHGHRLIPMPNPRLIGLPMGSWENIKTHTLPIRVGRPWADVPMGWIAGRASVRFGFLFCILWSGWFFTISHCKMWVLFALACSILEIKEQTDIQGTNIWLLVALRHYSSAAAELRH